MKEILTLWKPEDKILFSRLSGTISMEDNIKWEKDLYSESEKISEGGVFKLLLDVCGYEFDSITTHKLHRRIIPFFLARNNYFQAILEQEDLAELKKTTVAGKRKCVAVAIIHHDPEKMKNLDEAHGTASERYLSSYSEGHDWIKSIQL